MKLFYEFQSTAISFDMPKRATHKFKRDHCVAGGIEGARTGREKTQKLTRQNVNKING
jgi:hypothetical protein